MNYFLAGFSDELTKVAAFPQQHHDAGAYDSTSAVQGAMDKYLGSGAKAGLKSGSIIQPAPVEKKRSPTPLTSPNAMVDYASKS